MSNIFRVYAFSKYGCSGSGIMDFAAGIVLSSPVNFSGSVGAFIVDSDVEGSTISLLVVALLGSVRIISAVGSLTFFLRSTFA